MDERGELASRWPQFALSITVGDARLVAPTDADLMKLALQAATPGAILPAPQSHFVTWIGDRSPDEIGHDIADRVECNRDLSRRPGWTLDLAVIVDGTPVGMQSISGFDRWPHRRVVGTSSWLLSAFQRDGLGTRCRAAALELAFVHLQAERARSWALEDNRASAGVSTRLGYTLTGSCGIVENGARHSELIYEIEADDWLRSATRQRLAPTVTGVEALVDLLNC